MESSIFNDSEPLMDQIHGLIKISEVEKQLIGAPEFQRLRKIKQLGFVNLVFPSAEHSRFVHSIGVCHKAKQLVDQINENIKREKRYQSWRMKGINNDIPISDEFRYLISPVERIVISLAALTHDLPHSPFSHEIESPDSDLLKGIPVHDEFDSNPVFYRYLFNPASKFAQLLKIHNAAFWELLLEDPKWGEKFKKFMEDGIISKDGEIIIQKIKDIGTDEKVRKLEVSENSKQYPIQGEKEFDIKALPILGVMVFEIHLFDKPKKWVKEKSKKDKGVFIDNTDPIIVKTEWEGNESNLHWRPIFGWFRPYRKDIVGNTICADLIDYLERDGKNTGIISSLDLKFLDRMTIAKTIPSDDSPTDLNIPWNNIPETCEHIIFDIFDHKRGFIRDSIITEMLSCLQARYQLAERVYNHRVVEGARSMLQEIAKLLCAVGELKVEYLHSVGSEMENPPTGDETFLAWVINKQAVCEKYEGKKKINVQKAIELAKHIQERRIYREAVIIDGIHGNTIGTLAGTESNCKALADILLSEDMDQFANELSEELGEDSVYKGRNPLPSSLVTIGVRRFGKRYKVPRVLVAKPLPHQNEDGNLELEIQPLFVCQDPPHIKNRLVAMKAAYDSLWRIYLFIHPAFHSIEYQDAHKRIIAAKFLKFINKKTKIEWKNSVIINQLLPKKPIDILEFISTQEYVISLEIRSIYPFAKQFLEICYKKLTDPVAEGKTIIFKDEYVERFITMQIIPNKVIRDYLLEDANQVGMIKKLKKWIPNTLAAREDDIFAIAIEFITNNKTLL